MNLQFVKGTPIFTNINENLKQYNYLTENVETEVTIVGGGITGAILGYYFVKKGIKTLILEKGRIGYGSTSSTTSLLQYELDDNAMELIDVIPKENIETIYKLGLKALDEIEDIISEYGNKCDFKRRDTLLYTSKKLEIEEMKKEYEFRKNIGLDVDFISENDKRFDFDIKAGVYGINGGAEFDPYKYTHNLLEISSNLGLKIYENTEAIKVNYDDDLVTIETNYGYKVKSKIIIVATGYNTKAFTDRNFGTKTTTYNIATKPLNEIVGWHKNVLIRDNCDPYNYLRTTKDNRIIIGGEDERFEPDIFDESMANKKYNILENRLKSMFKNIKDIEIEYKYCGAFASTKDNIGFLGKDKKNEKLWYGLGYGANGILFATLGGMFLSDLYLGKVHKELELFNPNRFDN